MLERLVRHVVGHGHLHLGEQVAGWVTSYVAIARGEVATVSDTVPRLTGHPARSFAEYLRTR